MVANVSLLHLSPDLLSRKVLVQTRCSVPNNLFKLLETPKSLNKIHLLNWIWHFRLKSAMTSSSLEYRHDAIIFVFLCSFFLFCFYLWFWRHCLSVDISKDAGKLFSNSSKIDALLFITFLGDFGLSFFFSLADSLCTFWDFGLLVGHISSTHQTSHCFLGYGYDLGWREVWVRIKNTGIRTLFCGCSWFHLIACLLPGPTYFPCLHLLL